VRALEWLNFFVADVQAGVGPFLAAYLASSGWNPGRVGYALTFGGMTTVVLQLPAGAWIDATRRKRALLAWMIAAIVAGALLFAWKPAVPQVAAGQLLIGSAGAFLGPLLAAITLGIVGKSAFDRQFGRNQAFNSAGNVFTALLLAAISFTLGNRTIFLTAAALALPALAVLRMLDGGAIDYERARGLEKARGDGAGNSESLGLLLRDRVLVTFLACAFLFHLANAAMLPELGEMLSKGQSRTAVPFMSACIIVTQCVIAAFAAKIGALAATRGRRSLLLAGFAILPVRGILYTLTSFTPALIAIQILDGVANAIFVVVSVLVIADRTRGTGRFNLAQGALALVVGSGAALSNALGGELAQRFGFHVSFLGLAGIAAFATILLFFALPETLEA
jgi:MFS family permease